MAGNNQMPDKEEIFGMPEKEIKHTPRLAKCHETSYKDSNLNNSVAKHRCVSKFKQVTNLIGQLLDSRRPPK